MNFFLLLTMTVVATFSSENIIAKDSATATVNPPAASDVPAPSVQDQVVAVTNGIEQMPSLSATLLDSLPKSVDDNDNDNDNEPKQPILPLLNSLSVRYYLNSVIASYAILQDQSKKLFKDYRLFIKLVDFMTQALFVYFTVFIAAFIVFKPIALLLSRRHNQVITLLFGEFFNGLPELFCAAIYPALTFLQNTKIIELKKHYPVQLMADPLFNEYIYIASFMCLGIFVIKILNALESLLKNSILSWNIYRTFAIQWFYTKCIFLIAISFVGATEYSGTIDFCKQIQSVKTLFDFLFTAILTIRLQKSINFGDIPIGKVINCLSFPIMISGGFAYLLRMPEAIFIYRLLLSVVVIPIFERLYFIIRLIAFEYIKRLPRIAVKYLIRLFIIFVTGLRFALTPLSLVCMLHIFGINILNEIKFLVIKNEIMARLTLILILVGVVLTIRMINLYFWAAYEKVESIARPFDKQRIETLTVLFRNLIFIFMYLISLFVFLSILGIDISPLFQSVGFMSAALSFSLQEFIRDIVNGLLLLYNNTLKVGDLIEYEKRTAVVEVMSIRYFRIRYDDGLLITIPFHRVDQVRNKSRQQSYVIFNISFARSVDIKLAEDAIREAFNNVREQSEYRYKVLKDLEMRDIAEVTAFSYVMQCRICVQPNSQYKIKRALNKEIKNLLDKYNIELAFPPVANAINSPSLSTGDTFPDFQ